MLEKEGLLLGCFTDLPRLHGLVWLMKEMPDLTAELKGWGTPQTQSFEWLKCA